MMEGWGNSQLAHVTLTCNPFHDYVHPHLNSEDSVLLYQGL